MVMVFFAIAENFTETAKLCQISWIFALTCSEQPKKSQDFAIIATVKLGRQRIVHFKGPLYINTYINMYTGHVPIVPSISKETLQGQPKICGFPHPEVQPRKESVPCLQRFFVSLCLARNPPKSSYLIGKNRRIRIAYELESIVMCSVKEYGNSYSVILSII